jgi:hypothetical protein
MENGWTEGKSAEDQFKAQAIEQGWKVVRAGWPDFLLTGLGPRPVFVEVKGVGDRIRPSQKRMFAALELAGVRVYVWWELTPNSLIPWRKFLASQNAYAASARKVIKKARPPKFRNPRMYSHSETAQLERMTDEELLR